MTRIKQGSIKGLSDAVDEINIYANEGDIYTVGLSVGGNELTVCDDDDTPMLFRSLAQAKLAFKNCRRAKTNIVCATAYDEMIGHKKDPSTFVRD